MPVAVATELAEPVEEELVDKAELLILAVVVVADSDLVELDLVVLALSSFATQTLLELH
jgi:hypothetical protein